MIPRTGSVGPNNPQHPLTIISTRHSTAGSRKTPAPSSSEESHDTSWFPGLGGGVDGYILRNQDLNRLVSVAEWVYGSPRKKQVIKDYLWTRYKNQAHREDLLKNASDAHYDKLCRSIDACLDANYRGSRMRQTCRSFIDTVLFNPKSKAQAETYLKKWALARHEDRNASPTWSSDELKSDDKTMAELINCARKILRHDPVFVGSLFSPEPETQSWPAKIKGFFLRTWTLIKTETARFLKRLYNFFKLAKVNHCINARY